MEAPQSDTGPDSMGDREDFGVYSQLRETVKDKTRMSLPRIGASKLANHDVHLSASLSLHMRGGHYMDMPQRVQMKFQCAESDDDVRSFRSNTATLTWYLGAPFLWRSERHTYLHMVHETRVHTSISNPLGRQ